MNINRKIPFSLAIAIIIVLVFFIGGVLFAWYYWFLNQEIETPIGKEIIAKKIWKEQKEQMSEEDSIRWSVYKNTEYGFTIEYPENYSFLLTGPNEAQKALDRGEQISGTVQPSYETVIFQDEDKEMVAKIEIFHKYDKPISKKEYREGYLYSYGPCDFRFGFEPIYSYYTSPIIFFKNLIVGGKKENNFLVCYYIKNEKGNLIVFSFVKKEDNLDGIDVGDKMMRRIYIENSQSQYIKLKEKLEGVRSKTEEGKRVYSYKIDENNKIIISQTGEADDLIADLVLEKDNRKIVLEEGTIPLRFFEEATKIFRTNEENVLLLKIAWGDICSFFASYYFIDIEKEKIVLIIREDDGRFLPKIKIEKEGNPIQISLEIDGNKCCPPGVECAFHLYKYDRFTSYSDIKINGKYTGLLKNPIIVRCFSPADCDVYEPSCRLETTNIRRDFSGLDFRLSCHKPEKAKDLSDRIVEIREEYFHLDFSNPYNPFRIETID